MSERIEAAAKAMNDLSYLEWDELHDDERNAIIEDASAAINAYHALTADQWDEFADIIDHLPDADDALTALGFHRADEVESAS